MDFEKCVIDRISWSKEEVEEAILKQREPSFWMAVGKLLELFNLAETIGFLETVLPDGFSDYEIYLNSLIDRFWKGC